MILRSLEYKTISNIHVFGKKEYSSVMFLFVVNLYYLLLQGKQNIKYNSLLQWTAYKNEWKYDVLCFFEESVNDFENLESENRTEH